MWDDLLKNKNICPFEKEWAKPLSASEILDVVKFYEDHDWTIKRFLNNCKVISQQDVKIYIASIDKLMGHFAFLLSVHAFDASSSNNYNRVDFVQKIGKRVDAIRDLISSDKFINNIYDYEKNRLSEVETKRLRAVALANKLKYLLQNNDFYVDLVCIYFDSVFSQRAGSSLIDNIYYYSDLIFGDKKVKKYIFLEQYFLLIVDSVEQVLNKRDLLLSVMGDYRSVLHQKRNQLFAKDEFGDFDLSQWKSYVERFFAAKVMHFFYSPFFVDFSDIPDDVHKVFKIKKLNFSLGLFFQALMDDFLEQDDHDQLQMTGFDYEVHIEKIISDFFEGSRFSIARTVSTGDFGADIIFSCNNKTTVIQVKYYSGSVGVKAVQEVSSSKLFYNADYAVVVTNSRYTKAAKSLADKSSVSLLHEDKVIDGLCFLHNYNE